MKAHWLDDESGTLSEDFLRQQGVTYARYDTHPDAFQGPLDDLKAKHGYVTQDEVALTPDMDNLEEICAKFVDEHHHTEDEVRFVLEGEGIFDIRTDDDRWMRVVVEKGDLIVVPKDRHHRFFLTDQKMIRCVRLFKDPAGWVAHYRSRPANH